MAPVSIGTRHVEHVMGTAVSVDIRCEVAPEAVAEAMRYLHRVDATFSVFRVDSEISRIGSGRLHPDDASRDVREILVECESLRTATDRSFDHRPEREGARHLDPSGLVKGWAIDRAADMLRDAGATRFCINAGGDVVAIGSAEGTAAWRVGIRHPQRAGSLAAVVSVRDAAVATSAAYERGNHVWDRRAGRGAGLASATVVGPELGIADALATALFANGEINPAWMDRFPDYLLLAIDTRGTLHHSPALDLDQRFMGGTAA